jgi:hypothetical protein
MIGRKPGDAGRIPRRLHTMGPAHLGHGRESRGFNRNGPK